MALIILTPGAWAQDTEPPSDRSTRLEDVFDRGCGDEDGTDRCDAEVQRRMRGLYGLTDVETLPGQGVTLRRVMFVDGYGTDVAAISFSRMPGYSPTVEVSTPRNELQPDPQPLQAVIKQSVWDRVLRSSRHFDRTLEGERRPGVSDERGQITICLHGWFVVVEAANAPRLDQNVAGQEMEPSQIRSNAEGTCNGGLAAPYAFQLAEIALDNLNECSSLRSEHARNDPALLALCHRMRGDRVAAGEAYEFAHELRSLQPLPEGERLRWLFASRARELAEPFRAALNGGTFYFNAPHAADVDHAEVDGLVMFQETDEIADIKLSLVRNNGDFVIQSYELSERRPDN